MQGHARAHPELVLGEQAVIAHRLIENRVSEALRIGFPVSRAGRVPAEVLGERRKIGVLVRAILVAAVVGVILGAQEVEAELPDVPPGDQRQVIGYLEPVLAGIDARHVGVRSEVGLPLHHDLDQAGGRNQAGVEVVGVAVLEPAEAELVDPRPVGNVHPLDSGIARAHRRVAVRAHARAIVQRRLRLKSVGRNPAQVVEAGAEAIGLRRHPVQLAEEQVRIGCPVQNLELAIQKLERGGALRRAGRAGADKRSRAIE